MRRPAMLALLFTFTMTASTALAAGPQAKISRGGPVALKASLSHPYLPANESSQLYASIRLRAGEASSGDRLPMNLALVIDRSTSMRGKKFTDAIASARQVVGRLGSRDRIAIISYGNAVNVELRSTLVTQSNRAKITQAINRIELQGSTNIGGGYEKAVEIIKGYATDERVSRILLLSDGQANVGIIDSGSLGALAREGLHKGVTLSTLGFGLDYNEDIMTAMARQGAGQFYHVEEGDLAKVFTNELKGLSSVVAKRARLEIELGKGVELLKVHGFAHSTKGRKVTIRLASFHALQSKDILLKLSVSAQGAGAKPVASVKLRYRDVASSKTRSVKGDLAVVATTDSKKVRRAVNKGTVRRVQQVETSESLDQAMKAYRKGKRKEAKKILSAQRKSNAAAVKNYQFDDDGAFGRVDKELESMEKTVTRHKAGSSAGKRARKKSKKRSYDIESSADLF